MQLSNCELLPGVIVDTKDPMKLGRIKCVIPGYVDSEFSNENMPWVRPLGMNRHQSFSKMMPGYKVWVLVNKSNYNEYWYFPFFEFTDISKEYLNEVYDDEQPEIIMSHNCGGNNALITYDEKNGFNISIGEKNHVEIHPDGHISIQGGDSEIDIDGSNIKIGNKNNEAELAVMGKKLVKVLSELKGAMNELKGKSSGMLYPLAEGFGLAETALTNVESILCKCTTVN